MKAVGYHSSLPINHEDALLDLDIENPKPEERDLLVRVKAVSVNPVDVKVRARAAPQAGQAKILGWDAAGVVEDIGSGVSLFKPGDEVFYAGAIDRQGTNAEYHCVDERIAGRKPASLTMLQAAALPLTSITAWELLFERLAIERNSAVKKSLLIVGGAGGVGSILIQLARKLTGLTVIATASRPETTAWCERMGAHAVISHKKDLHHQLEALRHGEVDYIASLTGTAEHAKAYEAIIKPNGKIGLIDDPDTFDAVPFKYKSVSIHYEWMFTRPRYETECMIEQHRLLNEAGRIVDDGVLQTTQSVDLGAMNAANLKKAHALIESGSSIGKVVLHGF